MLLCFNVFRERNIAHLKCQKIDDNKVLSFPFSIFSVSEISSCHMAQDGLELKILLPQFPKFWRYRYMPPKLAEDFY
jgi:hypothetical protein